MKAVVMTSYVIWCLLLFVVLATTADDYFAPSLTTLSEWMGLRERVAGLTFLALGNGAADMFSVIAAVRVGATDLAVGALQGGSMCVTCVVTAGVLMVVRGGEVKASGVFFADVLVNIISCVVIFIILNKGYTTFWEGLGLLGLYTVYVLGVSMVGHGWIPPMLVKDRAAWRLKKEAEADLQEHLAVVSYFWRTCFFQCGSRVTLASPLLVLRATVHSTGRASVMWPRPWVWSDPGSHPTDRTKSQYRMNKISRGRKNQTSSRL